MDDCGICNKHMSVTDAEDALFVHVGCVGTPARKPPADPERNYAILAAASRLMVSDMTAWRYSVEYPATDRIPVIVTCAEQLLAEIESRQQ